MQFLSRLPGISTNQAMDSNLLAACEALAINVLDDETNISDEDIVQWHRLFNFAHADARAAIQD